MIKIYEFDYACREASATFEIDLDVFTPDMAKEALSFFSWDYDKNADPIDEMMKKYAIEAIKIATFNNYNEIGVRSEINELEGFCPVDGTRGITLTDVLGYEFDEDSLSVEILPKYI